MLLVTAAIVMTVGGLSISSAQRDRHRVEDVARIRSLFEQHPLFPGAELAEEVVVEQCGDGACTGHFSLYLTYRLPDAATEAEVLGFHRAHLPAALIVAGDETCRAARPEFLPDGEAVEGEWLLYEMDGALTTLAPPSSGRGDGVTFQVRRDAGQNQLRLSLPSYVCGGPDLPDPAGVLAERVT